MRKAGGGTTTIVVVLFIVITGNTLNMPFLLRFLRRNQSIMADVAMGQALNTVTCPECNYSSRNFDPFNLLSIPTNVRQWLRSFDIRLDETFDLLLADKLVGLSRGVADQITAIHVLCSSD